jgi:nitrite reductase/ring-hydroxylating ferredoxin subunit
VSSARRVASLDEVPAGQPKVVELDGIRVVLARVGDAVYALNGARLACPWHGWMFDVRTGQCVFPGRGASVPSYPVRLEAGEVLVELP